MRIWDNDNNELTKEKLLEIIDSFLEYKPVFDKKVKDNKVDQNKAVSSLIRLLFDYDIVDKNKLHNLDVMKEKYGERFIRQLSTKKLNFFEIITILTFIYRQNYHMGGVGYDYYIENNIFYNLLCRMEEIKKEL